MVKHIYLVRHCHATAQEATAPLTDEGRKQAEHLAAYLAQYPIDLIVSSPFERAMSSIAPFATERALPVEIDQRLTERILSEQSLDDWMERLRETFTDLSLRFPGGESSATAMARVNEALTDVLSRDASHTVLVTHGCLLTLLLKSRDDSFGFEDWKQLSNPDVFLLTITDEACQITRIWE